MVASPSPRLGTLSANSRSLPALIWGRAPSPPPPTPRRGLPGPGCTPQGRESKQLTRVTPYPRQGAPGLPAHAEKGSVSQGCRFQEPTRGAAQDMDLEAKNSLDPPPPPCPCHHGNPHHSILGV